MTKISEEVIATYSAGKLRISYPLVTLADFARDTLAELRRMQWLMTGSGFESWAMRQHWTDDQWRELADKELRGDKAGK